MDTSRFLTARTEPIIDAALAALARRRLTHYERLGLEASKRKLRDLFDRVVEGAQTRNLGPVLAYAEQVGNERYESGFEFVEVRSAFNLLEEAIWHAILEDCPAAEQGTALGMVATVLGAAKDKLASTYLSRATETHVPTLDLAALFRGTQNTGGGAGNA
jgi:hypothetical protein